MPDIETRLRDSPWFPADPVFREAAEKIEQLRIRCARLERMISPGADLATLPDEIHIPPGTPPEQILNLVGDVQPAITDPVHYGGYVILAGNDDLLQRANCFVVIPRGDAASEPGRTIGL